MKDRNSCSKGDGSGCSARRTRLVASLSMLTGEEQTVHRPVFDAAQTCGAAADIDSFPGRNRCGRRELAPDYDGTRFSRGRPGKLPVLGQARSWRSFRSAHTVEDLSLIYVGALITNALSDPLDLRGGSAIRKRRRRRRVPTSWHSARVTTVKSRETRRLPRTKGVAGS